MRIWIGKEEEGQNKGLQTLFVCSDVLFIEELQKIRETANKAGIKRIYLGAGKTDVIKIAMNLKEMLFDYQIIIETSYNNLPCLRGHEQDFNSIILRADISTITENMNAKLDDGKNVIMFSQKIETNITEVKDGMYPKDIIVYE